MYSFNPEIIFVLIDIANLLHEHYYPSRSNIDRERLLNEKINEIESLVQKLAENCSGKIVLNNFRVPPTSPRGILENKEKFGLVGSIKYLNSRLEESFRSSSQVFVFDFDNFCSKHGKKHCTDYRMYYPADMKISPNFIPALCNEYLGYIKPLKSLNKKCLVRDLDNTLWGGIIGEDGFEGIKLGPEPPDSDMEIRDEIHNIAIEFPGYGYRRITEELRLRYRGNIMNHKRVLGLMREDNLLCIKRKFKPVTTDSNHSLRKYPNLIEGLEIT